ncbi:MAG: hypothetical protein KY464_17130 [Gemmatimonadetes bacterium]|nr:hypothetical protein [Gemmatimonadota bacterium]
MSDLDWRGDEYSNRWSVGYGCDEWQYEEGFRSEEDARDRFQQLLQNPPSEGAYPMDYALLRNQRGETVAAWSEPEEG